MLRAVLLGPPGAGKGTQAVKLVDKYQVPHISTGDIFRKNISEGTELGVKAKSYIDAGKLVPDELTCEIVTSRLLEDDCANGFLLDGFPRTIFQADKLDQFLKENGMKLDIVINLSVPSEQIISRLSGRRICRSCGASYNIVTIPPKKEGVCDRCGGELYQRKDDAPETVASRLKTYDEQTAPLVDYYKNTGVLADFDGTKDAEAIFGDIVQTIG
ncbi:MAG: adenylate kinase [Mobilibacterium timonense]|uniref:adenylate kinase n=1 Tax=Mobilibacterium timonense TaxID=1871012 RepID=UPI0009859397|nr:adenylate kinase [Mobilibacterium timonense]MBM6989897.1 adenylate kinase [Mobilibacterium timonense]